MAYNVSAILELGWIFNIGSIAVWQLLRALHVKRYIEGKMTPLMDAAGSISGITTHHEDFQHCCLLCLCTQCSIRRVQR